MSRLGKERQVLAGSALKVRSPDPAQLSSLREPGAQDPTSPQAPLMPQREWSARASQVLRTATRAHCCCHQVMEAGMAERFPVASRPRSHQRARVARALELSRTGPQPPPSSAPQLTCSREAWKVPGRKPPSATLSTRGPTPGRLAQRNL